MSIRILFLYITVASLSVYAFKDWFKSLCGLILLMAVMGHEDMPRSMLGINGLNTWNMLFGIIIVACLLSRHRECLVWDMPSYINILLLLYLGVVLVGVLRAIFDRSHIDQSWAFSDGSYRWRT